jgi:nicotinate-nucleotide adenylyltransferase
MLKIATAGLENMEVSDLELNREGTSYTYQTVQQVRRMYPDAKIFLLMGTDMFLSFHSWRNPELITKDAALAVFYRGDKNEVEAIKSRVAEVSWEVELIENPIIDISSTQLRRMLVFGCADSFLPQGVGDYIRSHGFYGTDECYRDLPMEELEKVVVSLLDPKRVAHVLGCRDTAVELAKIWGTDETDAARAGLLHDITKALDGPLQLTLSDAYGTILDKFGKDHPKTLHALTGSLVAQRIFGENEAVVSAIRSHTTGKAGMNTLEKIIYVADYMEPNRDFPGVNKLRHLAKTDLDGAMKLGLEMTLAHLARQGSSVSPESLEALAYFE